MTDHPGDYPSDYLSELFSLDGRVAVVTGGSSGIGRAIARALAGAGARVVLVARGHDALAQTAERLRDGGSEVAWVSADLADRFSLERGAREAAAAFGEPDILVNSAGINLRPPLGALTAGEWDLTMAVNLTAPFLLGQRFGPAMAGRGWGRIINIASQQAIRAFGHSGGYGASKGGLVSLTREAASDPARAAALAARTMIGRNGEAGDFEGIAVFLASRASDYVTGQVIFVDGGFSAT